MLKRSEVVAAQEAAREAAESCRIARDAQSEAVFARKNARLEAEVRHGREQSKSSRKALEDARDAETDAICRARWLELEVQALRAEAYRQDGELESFYGRCNASPWRLTGQDVRRAQELAALLHHEARFALPAPRLELGMRGVVVEVEGEEPPVTSFAHVVVRLQHDGGPQRWRIFVPTLRSMTPDEQARVGEYCARVFGGAVVEEPRGGFLRPGMRSKTKWVPEAATSPRDRQDFAELERDGLDPSPRVFGLNDRELLDPGEIVAAMKEAA